MRRAAQMHLSRMSYKTVFERIVQEKTDGRARNPFRTRLYQTRRPA